MYHRNLHTIGEWHLPTCKDIERQLLVEKGDLPLAKSILFQLFHEAN